MPTLAAAVVPLSRANQIASYLLLLGVSRNYGWLLVDPASRGVASKALGAVSVICLLAIIAWQFRSTLMTMVIAWYGFEELQTAACSIMYLIEPWHVEVGQSMCSARIEFDVGAIGMMIVGLIAHKMANLDGSKDV